MATRGDGLFGLPLLLTLAACPGDEDENETQNMTSAATESSSATDNPTTTADSDPTTDAPTTMSSDPTTEEPPTSSTGDSAGDCDPPCGSGEVCMDGACVPIEDTSSTGSAECGTNVSQSKECDACSHDACCDEIQACFGDETVEEDTDCLLLTNCVANDCGGSTTLEELETCIGDNCPEVAAELDTYLALNACQANNCQDVCFPG